MLIKHFKWLSSSNKFSYRTGLVRGQCWWRWWGWGGGREIFPFSDVLETTEWVCILKHYFKVQQKCWPGILWQFSICWTGLKMTVVPRGERGCLGFARTSRRNTSTCAGRIERVSARRDTAMPFAKPCCTLPVTTLTVLHSWFRSCVVPLKAPQGIVTNGMLVLWISFGYSKV